MGSSINIKAALDDIDQEVDMMANELWGGNTIGGVAPGTELFESPKFQELVQILMSEPILVQPTLNFVQQKLAQISLAKLQALYTPEELEELYKELEKNG